MIHGVKSAYDNNTLEVSSDLRVGIRAILKNGVLDQNNSLWSLSNRFKSISQSLLLLLFSKSSD